MRPSTFLTLPLVAVVTLVAACSASDPTTCERLEANLTSCGHEVPADFVSACAADDALAEHVAELGCEQLHQSADKVDFLGDPAAARVFGRHAERAFVGTNRLRGTACAFTVDEELTFRYRWESEDLTELPNSISPGHFGKALFRRKLIHSSGGGFDLSCLILGRCNETELSIAYDGDDRIVSVEYMVEDEVRESCGDFRATAR